MTAGLIELLLCGPRGKTHESVFVADCSPLDVQTGLLLLDVKPGRPPAERGVGMPDGPKLQISVEWGKDTKHSKQAEKFIYNTKQDAVVPGTDWVFTGSVVENGRFMAMAEESIIATYWDPWAIVNLPLPCGSNDEILVVDRDSIPPLNTLVHIRIEVR
jgi:hypothetical protein